MKKPSGIPAKRYKTPTVIQMEALECGAASLAIILGYHGRYVSLEEVRTRCNVNRDGVKAGNITRAARSYGLEARGFHKSLEKMVQMPLPSIIHWNFNHFLVLEGLDDNHVYLNDPAYGPRKVSWDELDAAYTGIALQFTPAADFEAGRSKPTLRGLLARRLRGSRPALVFILLVSLLLLVPGIAQAGIAGAYIDSILVGASGDLPGLVAVMALLGVGMLGLGWLQMRYLLRLETKFALKTSAEYFWHVLRLPMGFFTQRFAGDIGARVALNDEIAVLLSRDLAVTFISVLFIGFYGLVMLQFSVLLTVITVLIALVNLVVLRIISRRRKDANTRALQEQGKMTGMVMAGLFNIEPLKARGAEAMLFSQVAGYHAKAINAEGDFKRLSAILTALPPALMMLAGTVVIVAGSVLVMDDALSVGMLIAFYGLMMAFLLPVQDLVGLGGKLEQVEGQLNRLEDVLNYTEDSALVHEDLSTETPTARLQGKLELRGLTFGYDRLGKPLIEDFDLTLKPGDRVALVGRSGSGKSTVAKLIAGIYQPWAGEIMFDGQPREAIPRPILTHSLGMVDQDILLFEGSVRDNLTLWDDTIRQSEVVAAARDAHIHAVILGRPGGYDSQVEENGRNFSGGQRQRLEIARALVTNPSILVLDEATSALDPVTEGIIDQHLRRRGCTTVIVAHRLSTIRDADEIIVLDKGKIVQRGTHQSLYRQKGAYRDLIAADDYESDDDPLEAIYDRLQEDARDDEH